ncbi:ferritin-like fold-containing protein [Cryobacterium sp. Y82]|uniref:ferritin-like fold-containing protein n=1 Tax=Cryobacterium sp. Y82 TaxID=2045017 RepID=UPI000CE32380|nr:ferritin-like fold-containing protein [Cryobacterium sp. Y82]
MVTWFGRRPQRNEAPRLSSRGAPQPTEKVDISSLAPDVQHFLGQAAYCELGEFESLARAVATAPNLDVKEGLSAAAGRALSKHHGLVTEIRRRGHEPATEMAPFVVSLDEFRRKTSGADWHELLLSCYLAGGLLEDFFIRLSDGLPRDIGPRVAQLLGENSGTDVLVHELQTAIENDVELGSRLAMWGRRLVGDTLLVARSAMPAADPGTDSGTGPGAAAEARIEPVFTELIAAHTRRMDGLGLTA